jgi:hypothetical protein
MTPSLRIGALMRREWFGPFETSMIPLGVNPVWLGESLHSLAPEISQDVHGLVVELSHEVLGSQGLPMNLQGLPLAGVPVAPDSDGLGETLGVSTILWGEEQAREWLSTLQGLEQTVSPPILVVWGTPGSPGASQLAIGLAHSIAQSRPTVLVDADFVAPSIAEILSVSGDHSGLLGALRVCRNDSPSWDSVMASAAPVAHSNSLRLLAGVRPGSLGRVEAGAMPTLLDSARSAGAAVVVEAKCVLGSPETSPEKSAVEAIMRGATHLYLVGRGTDLGVSRLVRDWNLLPFGDGDPGLTCVVRVPDSSRDSGFAEASAALWSLIGCSDIRELPHSPDITETSRVAELLEGVEGVVPHRPSPSRVARRGLRESLVTLLTPRVHQPLP